MLVKYGWYALCRGDPLVEGLFERLLMGCEVARRDAIRDAVSCGKDVGEVLELLPEMFHMLRSYQANARGYKSAHNAHHFMLLCLLHAAIDDEIT